MTFMAQSGSSPEEEAGRNLFFEALMDFYEKNHIPETQKSIFKLMLRGYEDDEMIEELEISEEEFSRAKSLLIDRLKVFFGVSVEAGGESNGFIISDDATGTVKTALVEQLREDTKQREYTLLEKTIEKVIERFKNDETEDVRTAAESLSKKGTRLFDAVIKGKDLYCLGFNGKVVDLPEEFNDILGYVEDLLKYLKHVDDKNKKEGNETHLAQEYILHEALCYETTHETAREMQKELFPENYPEKDEEGLLRNELRRYIDRFSIPIAHPKDKDISKLLLGAGTYVVSRVNRQIVTRINRWGGAKLKSGAFMMASASFWMGGIWISLLLSKITTKVLRPIKEQIYNIKGYTPDDVAVSHQKSNAWLLKNVAYPVIRTLEWLYESQKPITVEISKEDVLIDSDREVFEEKYLVSNANLAGEKDITKQMYKTIDIERVRNVLLSVGERKAAAYINNGIRFYSVKLDNAKDAPFVYLWQPYKRFLYSFATFELDDDEKKTFWWEVIKLIRKFFIFKTRALTGASIVEDAPSIYLSEVLVNRWSGGIENFNTKGALEALVAETLVHIAQKKHLEDFVGTGKPYNEKQANKIRKRIKYIQFYLSGMGSVGNDKVFDVIEKKKGLFRGLSNGRILEEELFELEFILEKEPERGSFLNISSGLDDLKHMETYGYWYKVRNQTKRSGTYRGKATHDRMIRYMEGATDLLATDYADFFAFVKAMALRYFIWRPKKEKQSGTFIGKWIDRLLVDVEVLKQRLAHHINTSVHAGLFSRADRLQKYNYFWCLEAGFSGRTAAWIISYTNRRVDDMKKGFIPYLGDQSRHYNMYMRDGRVRNGEHFKQYMGRDKMQGYVNNYVPDAWLDMDEENKKRLFVDNVLEEDTRKDWAEYEFQKSITNYIQGNIYKSLSSLGRGVHGLQDMLAHLGFDTGRYGTKAHHPDLDDEDKDVIGVDEKGEPVFVRGTKRIELTREISLEYYRAYMNVKAYIDTLVDEGKDPAEYQREIQTEINAQLERVWNIVDPLIMVVQVLTHLPVKVIPLSGNGKNEYVTDQEYIECMSDYLDIKEYHLISKLIGTPPVACSLNASVDADKKRDGFIQSKYGRAPHELKEIRKEKQDELKPVELDNFDEITGYIEKAIDGLEKKIPGEENEYVRGNLEEGVSTARDGLETLKEIFANGNIRSFKALVYGTEDFALGYGSDDEIGIAEEFLTLPMELMAELLFHEAICEGKGHTHYKAKELQQKLFTKNYYKTEKSRALSSELKDILRGLIDSRARMVSGSDPLAEVEKYTNGIDVAEPMFFDWGNNGSEKLAKLADGLDGTDNFIVYTGDVSYDFDHDPLSMIRGMSRMSMNDRDEDKAKRRKEKFKVLIMPGGGDSGYTGHISRA